MRYEFRRCVAQQAFLPVEPLKLGSGDRKLADRATIRSTDRHRRESARRYHAPDLCCSTPCGSGRRKFSTA